jgi:predicted cupin superfamily sugar epimerase
MNIEKLIKKLNLIPHPNEGGFFVETYRSEEKILKRNLPLRYSSERSFGTAIYYLLTSTTFSEIHRLKSDEIFHFYLGDPVEMINLFPDGKTKRIILGQDIFDGMELQVVVPRMVWQGAKVIDGGNFALLGTTVSPGFDYTDYESGNKEELIKLYPSYQDFINKLSK